MSNEYKVKLSNYFVKSNQDCKPITEDFFVLVADGMGSNPNIHNLSNFTDKEKFLNFLLDNYLKEVNPLVTSKLKDYIESSFKEVYVENVIEQSTSYLGSRICAILSYIYLLNNKDSIIENIESNKHFDSIVIPELKKFIHEGFASIYKHFKLTYTKNSSYSLFTTTLAITIFKEANSNVIVRAIWAGDSRSMVWHEKGMTKLSFGDANADGTMSNTVRYDPSKVDGKPLFNLNSVYETYKKPLSIFNLSDGYFTYDEENNYSHFYTQNNFIKSLNNAGSSEKWLEEFKNYFEGSGNYSGDDATIAFVGLGFTDFKHFKSFYTEGDSVLSKDLIEKFKRYSDGVSQKDPEEEDNRKTNWYLVFRDEIHKIANNSIESDNESIIKELGLEKYLDNRSKLRENLLKDFNKNKDSIVLKINNQTTDSEKIFLETKEILNYLEIVSNKDFQIIINEQKVISEITRIESLFESRYEEFTSRKIEKISEFNKKTPLLKDLSIKNYDLVLRDYYEVLNDLYGVLDSINDLSEMQKLINKNDVNQIPERMYKNELLRPYKKGNEELKSKKNELEKNLVQLEKIENYKKRALELIAIEVKAIDFDKDLSMYKNFSINKLNPYNGLKDLVNLNKDKQNLENHLDKTGITVTDKFIESENLRMLLSAKALEVIKGIRIVFTNENEPEYKKYLEIKSIFENVKS
jgi:serine/threonine protein phosphatase PrpC